MSVSHIHTPAVHVPQITTKPVAAPAVKAAVPKTVKVEVPQPSKTVTEKLA